MQQQTIVGLYPTRSVAEDVQSKLQAAGIPGSDISLGVSDTASQASAQEPKHEESFWEWLFGSEVTADERERYSGHLRSGHVAVSVRVRSNAKQEEVIALLEQFDPIDIEGDEATFVSKTSVAEDATRDSQALTGSVALAVAHDAPAGADRLAADGDRVIPITKEELEVGKRQVERRYRIRTHVIETPAEEQVHLQDERVVIERRPVTGSTVGTEDLQEREFDVIERHEEPVVQKRVRAVEEVVVHKDTRQRVETIRDTVRETKIDIDKDAAGDKPSVAQTYSDKSND